MAFALYYWSASEWAASIDIPTGSNLDMEWGNHPYLHYSTILVVNHQEWPGGELLLGSGHRTWLGSPQV